MSARAVPTMPDWVFQEEITSSLLNQITTYARFWANPPMFRMYQTIATTLTTSGNYYQLTMDTSDYDTDSGRSNASPYSYTIPPGMGGRWRFGVIASYAANASGVRAAAIYVNGSQANDAYWQVPSTSGVSILNVGGMTAIKVNSGDVISAYGYQTSGGSLATNTVAGLSSVFEGRLESLANP